MTYCLTIHDLDDGQDHKILDADVPLSHPVFHPDGDAIIALSEGSYVWIDLANPELLEIDTGACFDLAPGHGVSHDGAWFYFTDKTLTGAPAVYRLELGSEDDPEPVQGGFGQHFLGFDGNATPLMGELPEVDVTAKSIAAAGPENASAPAPWSPDGRAFAYVSR